MRAATLITLAVACALGCLLILYGGWWLLGAGAVIACRTDSSCMALRNVVINSDEMPMRAAAANCDSII